MANSNLKIGVDIGGTRTKSGLVNPRTGEVLHQIIQSTEKINAEIFLLQMNAVITECRGVAEAAGQTVTGIGFGVPGFTTTTGTVETTYGFLSFMENYPLKAIIEKEFALPCLIDNDARVVSLGEALYGKGKNSKRVLTLTLGTGVGFGFVVNRSFIDAMPLAHMGGHIKITDEGETCYCGKRGCLEALASSTGIMHLAKKQPSLRDKLSAESIFEAALNKDAAALEVVESLIRYLHTAIHNYVNLFAPDIIVLGGGVAKALQTYLDEIKGVNYLSPFPGYRLQLVVSELEELAGMLGSAALFQTQSINQTITHEG